MNQTKNKPKENDLYFVQLADASEIRRNILETLKDILVVLQKFEKLKAIRHEKLSHVQKSKLLFRQVSRMMTDLRAKLPQTDLKPIVIRQQKEKAKPGKAEAPKHEPKEEAKPKRKLSELERLEAEIGSIEQKLKSLS